MRRYTRRRDARNGQRHTLAEDIRMAALEALLPEELERHCQLQRSRLDTYQKLREEIVRYAEARGYVAPKLGQVSKAREGRDDPMLEDSGNGKDEPFPKERERTQLAKEGDRKRWCKIIGGANTQKIQGQCWNCGKRGHQSKDCWARPQQQSQGQSNSPGKGSDAKGKSGKGGGRKENPKMLEHLCGINNRARLRARCIVGWHG